jgi:methionyl-tRNA formyltransferase
MKTAFLGMPRFGAIILEKLNKSGYKPDSVNQFEDIKRIKPDLIIVANFGQILPQEILDIPQYGCLNVHPSLLPKYRGASPVQSAVLNGEAKTGVTIIFMDAQIDHGPILAQKETIIGPNETYSQLHDRLAALGAELLIDTLPDWIAGRIELREQDHKLAIYTKILTREDGKIDWRKSDEEIERQIRAFNPWPGTYTIWQKKRIKILKGMMENGKLRIMEVQPEGKKSMSFEAFLRGHKNFKLC